MPRIFVGQSFTVALFSGSEKFYGQHGGGEYQDFSSNIFCLIVPNIFVEESFSVAVISGIAKVWIRGAGSIQIFCQKFFVSQWRKIQYGNPLLH